jgi:hypothetical protein
MLLKHILVQAELFYLASEVRVVRRMTICEAELLAALQVGGGGKLIVIKALL